MTETGTDRQYSLTNRYGRGEFPDKRLQTGISRLRVRICSRGIFHLIVFYL